MSDVPSEIVTNILLRLAVKPLLRFRCVSKPWCALIDSPDFIKMHLNRSVQTNSNLSLILRYSYLYSVDLDSLDNAIKLTHPFKYGTEILGSSNGLLCLYDSDEHIFLWNPSTRNHHNLPVTDIEFPGTNAFGYCRSINYGFGYDHVNDDYKVVRMIRFYNIESGDSLNSEVKVYSLKSNSWRKIQDFPYYHCYERAYCMFANGALHWLVTQKPESDSAKLIVAFDLGTEKYRLVPQPKYSGKNFLTYVEVLGGCLCVVVSDFNLQYVDIWLMKDYGVKESWTKLVSVAQPKDIRSFHFVLPIAYSKSGEQVLLEQDHKRLVWYDLKRKTVQNVRICGLPYFFYSNVCVGSLVKLPNGCGGTNAKNRLAQVKRKKEKKKNNQVPRREMISCQRGSN